MSDEQNINSENDVDQSPFEDEAFVKREWEGRQTDWLLQWFVNFVNETPLEIGVTISMGGVLISGSLISHSSYFTKLADGFSSAFSNIEGADVAEIKRMMLGFHEKPVVREGERAPAPQYLHLSDVKVLTGSNVTNVNSVWRGKISSIDGFILGR